MISQLFLLKKVIYNRFICLTFQLKQNMIEEQYTQYQVTPQGQVLNIYKDQRSYPIPHKKYCIETAGKQLEIFLREKNAYKTVQQVYLENRSNENQNPQVRENENKKDKLQEKAKNWCSYLTKIFFVVFWTCLLIFFYWFIYIHEDIPQWKIKHKHQHRYSGEVNQRYDSPPKEEPIYL